MLSRIFWIGVAGIALIAGMVMQDGGGIFRWGDHHDVSMHRDQVIDRQVDRAIESSFDKMEVVGSDGKEIDVPAETKHAMAAAVGRLVKAEADIALARVGEDNEEEIRTATARRDQARAEVDRLKAQIKGYERAAQTENEALREQIRREAREDVRASVRAAVGG